MRLVIVASILSLAAPAAAFAEGASQGVVQPTQPVVSEADYRAATLRFRERMSEMTGQLTLARTARQQDAVVAFYQPHADFYAELLEERGRTAQANRARNLPRATAIRVRSQMLFRSQIGARSESPADLGRRIPD